ncbi:hypothetical protein LCGC14_0920410 [marine sediment metagenome]|uniref:Uncharacterized protein n=1 Tax=marine sediment metagenome TaxID=412755 RepID=A0A0F9R9Q2_9ZZZZ
MSRVWRVQVGGYVVSGDPAMIDRARRKLRRDIMEAVKRGELDQLIEVVPALSATMDDVPAFLKEKEDDGG